MCVVKCGKPVYQLPGGADFGIGYYFTAVQKAEADGAAVQSSFIYIRMLMQEVG